VLHVDEVEGGAAEDEPHLRAPLGVPAAQLRVRVDRAPRVVARGVPALGEAEDLAREGGGWAGGG
jgi:hypothetical protein